MIENSPDLDQFMRGDVDAAAFPHREHVRMGFEMLRRYDYIESVYRFSRILQAMAARAGKPQAFHQTVTVAFLSLIAERASSGEHADFDAFIRANPQLLDRSAITRRYPSEQLASDVARRSFLLPEPAQ
jgi:hypothetical protein